MNLGCHAKEFIPITPGDCHWSACYLCLAVNSWLTPSVSPLRHLSKLRVCPIEKLQRFSESWETALHTQHKAITVIWKYAYSSPLEVPVVTYDTFSVMKLNQKIFVFVLLLHLFGLKKWLILKHCSPTAVKVWWNSCECLHLGSQSWLALIIINLNSCKISWYLTEVWWCS